MTETEIRQRFDQLLALSEKQATMVRRKKKHHPGTPSDSGLRFDESQVPIKDIRLSCPELDGPESELYDIIRYEHTYRLAMHRSSYEVLRFMRPVLKRKGRETLITPPAPDNVFGKSFADVSVVAGMLVDKFVYHQPLYRQHQKLKASYIEISRATLTHLTEKAALLLEPVAKAVLDSTLQGALLALDETPSKAGRTKKAGAKHGNMRQGWFWPLYGDSDEIYFHFSPSRGAEVVHRLLQNFNGTLLSDGYSAYTSYVKHTESVTHALCWVHSRRYFERALEDEPELANQALDLIGFLCNYEKQIKDKKLSNADKLAYRGERSKAIVDKFFIWCTQLVDRPDLVATESPLLDAINYALKRETGLRAFLADPDIPLDTNHVERALRVIPCGKKNWLFNWSELGAHYAGIIQTLICSCRLQEVDPYTYLVDVMQRVSQHPASKVHELTPRNWKVHFEHRALQSYLQG